MTNTHRQMLASALALRSNPSQTLNVVALMNQMADTHPTAVPRDLAKGLWLAELITLGEYLTIVNDGFDFCPEG